MNPARSVKLLGREGGFDLVRISAATEMPEDRARYLDWIALGRHAEMRWITEDHALRSTSPQVILPDARSVISVGMSYWAGRRPESTGHGKVARYAWGRDYHRVMGERLERLAAQLQSSFGGEHRWCVDTGPALDRAYAVRSGIGWRGKNTNVISDHFGSYVLLGEILTTLPLDPDKPIAKSCGTCRLCEVACPTGAIGPAYSIDSSKCISYLTIEHRGPIPLDLRPLMGNWVFGCDICQDVCPPSMAPHLRTPEDRRNWTLEVRGQVRSAHQNAEAESDHDAEVAEVLSPYAASLPPTSGNRPIPPERNHMQTSHSPLFSHGIRPQLDLVWLLHLKHADYIEAFRGTAIKRAKVWMLRRNAAVALGNVGGTDAIAPLLDALRDDEHPIVRGHAAWAVGHIARRLHLNPPAELRIALDSETDSDVRDELKSVLAHELQCIGS